MANTVKTYTDLITSEHADKPNYMAMVAAMAAISVQTQDVIASLIPAFDLDTAVGAQLDIIGEWAGVSRNVSIPIPAVYFSFDGVNSSLGWDYGIWQGPLSPATVTVLPDDVYLNLIRAKIAANSWDGTTNGAYKIWEAVFPNITILIQDFQNMSIAIGIVGGTIDSLTLALLRGGAIPLKPEGVLVNEYFIPVNNGPLFGWDVQSDYLDGWDAGSWARELAPT